MAKRIVISSSTFRRKKALGMYTEMVIYKDEKRGKSITKHEIAKDQTRKFYK